MDKTIYLKDYQAPQWQVDSIDLVLQIYSGSTKVHSTLQLQDLTGSGKLQLHGEALQDIAFNIKTTDSDKDRQRASDKASKLLPIDFEFADGVYHLSNLPQQCTLVVTNTIEPESNTILSGLYKSNDFYCTQCEAEGFRRITAYLDRPDVMSVFTCRIEASKDFPVLLSNGNILEQGSLDDARHYVVWHDPHPKPAYLFAAVAGQLESISDQFTTMSNQPVLLEIYAEKKYHDKLTFAMEVLKSAMQWDEEYFGREYDLDRFMIVATEDFNFGAMENKGLNIFNVSALIASPDTSTDAQYERIRGIIAHEYFHNWSGNRVTLRDWFQLSLKEGFTVFRDAFYSRTVGEASTSRISEVQMLKHFQFKEDASRLSHPPRPSSYESIDNFYTSTVYEKGAEIVGMYRHLLGADKFRLATDQFFADNDGKAATLEDFYTCMQQQTDLDLSNFFNWYTEAGTPKVTVDSQWDAQRKTFSLEMQQSLESGGISAEENQKIFMIPIKFGLLDAQSGEELNIESDLMVFNQKQQKFVFENIDRPVIPSLLREFSAPVNLKLDISQDQISILAQHDTDALVRYEAMQKLMRDWIIAAAQSQINGNAMSHNLDSTLSEAVVAIFTSKNLSGVAKQMLLQIPSDAALQMNPMAIHECHKAAGVLQQQMAELLLPHAQNMLQLCSQALNDKPYLPAGEDANLRAMLLLCLNISVRNNHDPVDIKQLYFAADNLTIRLGCIRILQTGSQINIKYQAECQQYLAECLKDFSNRFAHLSQSMDAWLSMQACSHSTNVIETIRELYQHSHFSWSNPNRVRALVGSFSGNSVQFHTAAGYLLLSEAIAKVDVINPFASSSLFGQFSSIWRWPESLRSFALTAIDQNLRNRTNSKQLQEQINRILD